MNQTTSRKISHVDICLKKNVEARAKSAGFEDVELVHRAVPELDFRSIDIGCKFLKKNLDAPIVIEAITGGYEGALRINSELAKAAEKEKVVLALGSQRAMLEDQSLSSTYAIRKDAPSIPILGNIGLAQIGKYGVKRIGAAVEKIEADGLVVHLNVLQELCQEEGDRAFFGLLSSLEKLCSGVGCPVIAKETGAGISMETAAVLEKAGVAMIDVAGVGGTSWSGVEIYRGSKETRFWDWGIPTVQSVAECSSKVKIPVIASGGVRSGLDAAKSLALGASYTGAALPFLKRVHSGGHESLCTEIHRWKKELRMSMLLCGASDIKGLRKAPVLVTGNMAERLKARGLDIKKLAQR